MITKDTPRPRVEVVYMALQRLDAREIMRKVSVKEYTEYGDDNALLQELAKIVDAELQEEIERRRAAGLISPSGGAKG